MESVLKTIATQANLDRVLFTPGLKKLYFDMAVASGGATQFKHAESAKSGLSYICGKAGDKKRALLFCRAHELVQAFGDMLHAAAGLVPVAVLAVEQSSKGAETLFRDTGWMQFHTHTLQELYDHIGMAYHLFEAEKTRVPALILHSAEKHGSLGEWQAREDIAMGSPVAALGSGRPGKTIDFEAALAAVGKKKDVPTLEGSYEKLPGALREAYALFGAEPPEGGMPFARTGGDGPCAVVSLVPPDNAERAAKKDFVFLRPLVHRPFEPGAMLESAADKAVIAVVEPRGVPGAGAPPFYAEILASLPAGFAGTVLSVTVPGGCGVLGDQHLSQIEALVKTALAEGSQAKRFQRLD